MPDLTVEQVKQLEHSEDALKRYMSMSGLDLGREEQRIEERMDGIGKIFSRTVRYSFGTFAASLVGMLFAILGADSLPISLTAVSITVIATWMNISKNRELKQLRRERTELELLRDCVCFARVYKVSRERFLHLAGEAGLSWVKEWDARQGQEPTANTV